MTEAQLAQKFIAYFEGYEIYKEVPAAGIIDFMAVLGNIRVAVEVKKSFNWKVLEQAVNNLRYANYSYIAVPASKGMHFREKVAANYGVGVLCYSEEKGFECVGESVPAKLQRNIHRVKLRDWMKRGQAGVATERVTAFKVTVENICHFLRRTPEKKAPIATVFEDVSHHYRSSGSAKQCIINMCRQGVIKDFEYDNGYLKLAEPKEAV